MTTSTAAAPRTPMSGRVLEAATIFAVVGFLVMPRLDLGGRGLRV